MRIAVFMLLIGLSTWPQATWADGLSLKTQKFVLTNGLTVLVHEDHLTPAIAIQLGFRAGSRDEANGQSEFAHLFEHLMNGPSRNDKFQRGESLRKIGGLFINASTFADYTIYYATVPTHAVDAALWIEADRMGNLLPAIDQSVLDAQRRSVLNERREKDEDQPYGAARRLMARHMYPPDHPYGHFGSRYEDDLGGATLPDLRRWVQAYHGAANAVLVLAGDIDLQTAKVKAQKYFGHIPSGPPLNPRATIWVAKMNEPKRIVAQDRVPHTRVYVGWNVPPEYTAGAAEISVIGRILAGGPRSRLHERMIVRDKIATQVTASVDPRGLSSQFLITMTAGAGTPASRLEEVLDEELRRFIESGPSNEELARARTLIHLDKAKEIRYLGGKARALGVAELVTGSADAYNVELQQLQLTTPQSTRETAKQWLTAERLTLVFEPREADLRTTTDTMPERPAVTAPTETRAPVLKRLELANGLKVAIVDRPGSPLTDATVLLRGGTRADPRGKAGLARLAYSVLISGNHELLQRLESNGTRLTSFVDADATTVSATGLSDEMHRSLPLFADILLHPQFSDAVLEQQRARLLSDLHSEKRQAFDAARRLVPALLYGEMPFSGTGTEESVRSITRQDVEKYLRIHLNLRALTMILIGDLRQTEASTLLMQSFQRWPVTAASARQPISQERSLSGGIYVLDVPGVQQTAVFALHLAPPRKQPDDVAIEVAVDILGGPGGRIYRNLTTNKGWSYGAGSFIARMQGSRFVLTGGSFQSEKAIDAIRELGRELREFTTSNPPSPEELSDAKMRVPRIKPAFIEPIEMLGGVIREVVEFDFDSDYIGWSMRQVQNLSIADTRRAAALLFAEPPKAWVVVGSASGMETKLREAGFTNIHLLADESAAFMKR